VFVGSVCGQLTLAGGEIKRKSHGYWRILKTEPKLKIKLFQHKILKKEKGS
jgi:hypothetical protein